MDSSKDLFINPSDFSEIWEDVPADILRQLSQNNEADVLDTSESYYEERNTLRNVATVLDEYQNDLHITEEEECEISTNQNSNVLLSAECGLLVGDFKGIANFSFAIEIDQKLKNSWEYSHSLNQVFIDMNKYLIVEFFLEPKEVDDELFIRATPVYSNTDCINEPIKRCTIHWIEDDPYKQAHEGNECFCADYNLAGHVIRSPMQFARHCYDNNSRRHSVILPVDCLSKMPNKKAYRSLFEFACKTSCHKGMQRRPITVVFTLENISGHVIGRCSLAVKICSCPKRDMERLENLIPRGSHKNINKEYKNSQTDKNDPKIDLKNSIKQLNKLITSFRKVTKQMEDILK